MEKKHSNLLSQTLKEAARTKTSPNGDLQSSCVRSHLSSRIAPKPDTGSYSSHSQGGRQSSRKVRASPRRQAQPSATAARQRHRAACGTGSSGSWGSQLREHTTRGGVSATDNFKALLQHHKFSLHFANEIRDCLTQRDVLSAGQNTHIRQNTAVGAAGRRTPRKREEEGPGTQQNLLRALH